MSRAAQTIAVLGLLFGACPVARAQLHRATDPVATPASSLVLQDDALALDVNPAALGRLPAYSLALLHSEVDRRDDWLARGDALYLASPIFGPLSLGVTVQSIRPSRMAARPPGASDADRGMAAFGLALSPSGSFSVGLTTRTFASGNGRFDGLTAIDVGALLRPSRWLSVSLVGRDLFVSRSGFGTDGLDLASSGMISLGLRPFGGDWLTLDGTLVKSARSDVPVAARSGLVIALPHLGTAAGLVEVDDLGRPSSALRVVAELALNAGQASAMFGGTSGDGFAGKLGWYAMLRAEGEDRPGLGPLVRVVDIELSGLSPRSQIAAVLALERARSDPRVGGVLLRPRSSGMGLAYAQELRLQIRALRAAGKPVVCHVDSASGAEYYACAAADSTLLDPAGDVRLLGSASSVMLFGETLRKIGVRADFLRIGPYKSAPEQYTQGQMSDAARRETASLLDDAHERVLSDLAADLHKSREKIAQIMDSGPHLASSAIREGLVKQTADEHDFGEEGLAIFGGKRMARELPKDEPRAWGKRPAIGVVVVDDEIVDGESVDIPFIDIHMTGGETVIDTLDAMAADPNIRAIVLRVDSPGGAAQASDKIWRAVRRAREKKPVVASMGALAASGGYYVASAADEIWAEPTTLTGSIGIFYGKVDVAQLAEKLGVKIENFQRGKRAGAESIFRPFTDEERAALADLMRNYYGLFLSRVAEGRRMSVEAVDAVGRGRVYSGDAAQRLGLVDRLGGLSSALIRARALAGLGPDAGVDVRPPRKNRLLDYILGTSSSVKAEDTTQVGTAAPISLPAQMRSLLRMALTLEHLGSGEPLALMPYDLAL
ncbi:MAG: signal peptide peptidase SppA [Polyangiales bacterium]